LGATLQVWALSPVTLLPPSVTACLAPTTAVLANLCESSRKYLRRIKALPNFHLVTPGTATGRGD